MAAEVQQLQDAHDRVAALGKRHVTVYASVPEAAASLPARRQLQGVQADVGTCDQLCQVGLAARLLGRWGFAGVMLCGYVIEGGTHWAVRFFSVKHLEHFMV